MIRSRLLRWLVAATMTSVTVVVLFTAAELSLLAVVAYLIYRIAKLALILWGMKLLERWRSPALAPT